MPRRHPRWYVGRVDDELTAAGLARPERRRDRSPLDLTPRERDVVTLVIEGATNQSVADQLFVSKKAIEFHLRNIYGKLGIGSRNQLRSALSDR